MKNGDEKTNSGRAVDDVNAPASNTRTASKAAAAATFPQLLSRFKPNNVLLKLVRRVRSFLTHKDDIISVTRLYG